MYKDEPISKDTELIADYVADLRNGLKSDELRELFHNNDEMLDAICNWLDDEANELTTAEFDIDSDSIKLGDAIRLWVINQIMKQGRVDEILGDYARERLSDD